MDAGAPDATGSAVAFSFDPGGLATQKIIVAR
jgi:hypothetical protein